MPIVIQRRIKRTTQPSNVKRISSELLNNGLISAVAMIGGIPYDLINQKFLLGFGGANIKVGPNGYAAFIDSASSAFEDTSTPIRPSTELSIYWVGASVGTPTTDGAIAGISYSNDSGQFPYIAAFLKYGITTDLIFNYNVGGVAKSIAVSSSIDSTKTSLCGTFKSGSQVLYKNGVQIAAGSDEGGINYGSNPRLIIGEDYRLASRNSNTRTDLLLVFNRALTPAYIKRLDEIALWQVFDDKKQFIYLPASSGLSLILQNITLAQALTEPSLTQQNTLATNNLLSSQILNNIDLTQQNILTIDSTLENQSIDNLVLLAGGNLTVQGIISNSVLNNIDLIQQNALSLGSIQVTQFLQNVDLIQQNIISIASLTDSQGLSNITLNQGGALIVSEITQQVLLETVNLIQQNILSIDSINLSQSIENINLSQQNILSIESTLSSETLDNITLNTTLLLSPDSIVETINLSNLVLIQANLLAINNLLGTSSLSTISLTGQHVLIVNDTIHSQILQNITLTAGFTEERINGEPVYILKSSPSVMIISAKTTIYLSQP
jgi:hypothetical protein